MVPQKSKQNNAYPTYPTPKLPQVALNPDQVCKYKTNLLKRNVQAHPNFLSTHWRWGWERETWWRKTEQQVNSSKVGQKHTTFAEHLPNVAKQTSGSHKVTRTPNSPTPRTLPRGLFDIQRPAFHLQIAIPFVDQGAGIVRQNLQVTSLGCYRYLRVSFLPYWEERECVLYH